MSEGKHRATIETIINSVALALTSFGVVRITTGGVQMWEGYCAIAFGVLLEFIKYFGRQKSLW